MAALLQQRLIDPQRRLLAAVLALFAGVMIVGGSRLVSLGGSTYYLIAGLALLGSAYFIARGDRRGIWLYAVMLAGTAIWAFAECGSSLWGLQARLLAFLVLGAWVFWPSFRPHQGRWAAAILMAVGIIALIITMSANRVEHVDAAGAVPAGGSGEWPHYGNDLGGTRFSQVTQINASNVGRLEQAWVYRTGVQQSFMGFETTPLMVGDTLYLCTPNNIVIALDPDTGKHRWVFDPHTNVPPVAACRGVAYYKVAGSSGSCAERVIIATVDARLMAVDSRSGELCPAFGNNGTVDLKPGMGPVRKGYYYVSSAPAIVRGNVILGGWVLDGQYVGEPPGVIRAFDAVTGKFSWALDVDHPDFHGEPPPGQTYSLGTPNSWGPISADEALGLVYLPTGNSTPDYWGGQRSAGSEKYSSSVLAVDAATGAIRWSFQTAHHDLWDYDVAGQPTLIDLQIDGKTVPALVQPTKRGQMFLLDRRDGTPLAKVEERAVPQGPAPGDFVAPTQPFSTGLPAFDNTLLNERIMWGTTPIDQLWCRIKFREARYEGPMTPPGLGPTITYPSYLGGIDWGGVSVDPERRLLVVNWNRVANYTRLVPRSEAPNVKASESGGIHVGEPVPQIGTPFALFTAAFLSPIGIPCNEPPFGEIGVVDLQTRRMIWQRPLGTSSDSGPFDMQSHIPLEMGVPNIGGSLTTRAGLIFIGATQERAIRAFDINTGKLLWRAPLPAGGHASPMTYFSAKSGRQFVVIAAGGNAPLHSGVGDYVVAFALPAKR
jgi:quinoprotein glucose dehydrogenase